MNPLEKQIEELREEVRALRAGQDIELNENIRRRSLVDIVSAGTKETATTSNVLKAVNESGSSSYNVTIAADFAQRVEIDGTTYYIPLISI